MSSVPLTSPLFFDPEPSFEHHDIDAQLEWVVDRLTPFGALEQDLDPGLFETLGSRTHKDRLVAVDGSHRLLLDGRSFIIIALRAGTVTYRGHTQQGTKTPLRVLFIDQRELASVYRTGWESLAKALDLGDWNAPVIPGIQAAPERLRELGEWLVSARALDSLDAGDILLVDGALRSPTRPGQAVLSALARKALDREVGLVAVAKRSALSLNSLPLLPTLERLAEREGMKGAWAYPLAGVVTTRSAGEVWAASFLPGVPTAFRVDVAGGLEPCVALGKLCDYCSDILYPGYPHPLARIHNHVFLSAQHGRDLIQTLQSRTLAAGLPSAAWRVLFADFHSVLDRSV